MSKSNVSRTQNSVVFFELPAISAERAKRFYEKAFGWKIVHNPGLNVHMLGTAPSDQRGRATEPGTINGIMSGQSKGNASTVLIVDVDDIDTAVEKVKDLGGNIVQEKQEVPGIGYIAYFKDTEGNKLQLFERINRS